MKDSDGKAKTDLTDEEAQHHEKERENPPRTTTGKLTSPMFGSAGSGGAELEPGPERD